MVAVAGNNGLYAAHQADDYPGDSKVVFGSNHDGLEGFVGWKELYRIGLGAVDFYGRFVIY